jgi:hypothetical protein
MGDAQGRLYEVGMVLLDPPRVRLAVVNHHCGTQP